MPVLSSIQNIHLHCLILNWFILFSDTFNNYCFKTILFIYFLNFSSTTVYKQYYIHKIKSNINMEGKVATVYFIYYVYKNYDNLLTVLYFPKQTKKETKEKQKGESFQFSFQMWVLFWCDYFNYWFVFAHQPLERYAYVCVCESVLCPLSCVTYCSSDIFRIAFSIPYPL